MAAIASSIEEVWRPRAALALRDPGISSAMDHRLSRTINGLRAKLCRTQYISDGNHYGTKQISRSSIFFRAKQGSMLSIQENCIIQIRRPKTGKKVKTIRRTSQEKNDWFQLCDQKWRQQNPLEINPLSRETLDMVFVNKSVTQKIVVNKADNNRHFFIN